MARPLRWDSHATRVQPVVSQTGSRICVTAISPATAKGNSMTSKAVSTLRGKVVRGFAAFALACAAVAPMGSFAAGTGSSIFSKDPFVPFDGPSPTQMMIKTVEGYNGYKNGIPVPWGGQSTEVTLIAYPYYSDSDGMASKAVAMVRVKNPNDNMIS